MTDPVRPLEALIAALIVKWRENAEQTFDDGDLCCAVTRENDADELAALLQAAAPQGERKGHIDSDCEVVRGVGWMCTCRSAAEKAEDARERAECEAEQDAASAPAPPAPTAEPRRPLPPEVLGDKRPAVEPREEPK